MRAYLLILAFAVFSGLPHSARAAQGPAPQSSSAIPMPADRAADSYAIYSLLMPGEIFSSFAPEQTQRWTIADTTVNETDRNPAVPPEGQLKAPPDNVAAFHEAVKDYQTNKYQRVLLTAEPFRINHPFSLLIPAEVDELRLSRTAANPNSAVQAKYIGVPGITFFSEVYFNTKHTAALVYINDWCASLCAAGQWVYLEKHKGYWTKRSGITVPGA
jgi:hypothetical protein